MTRPARNLHSYTRDYVTGLYDLIVHPRERGQQGTVHPGLTLAEYETAEKHLRGEQHQERECRICNTGGEDERPI